MGNNNGCLVALLTAFVTVITGLVIGLIFAMIFAIFATWLWNWIMPVMFGLPVISYLQMLGLMILARLIFPTGTTNNNKKND